jgi:hypothetical protein
MQQNHFMLVGALNAVALSHHLSCTHRFVLVVLLLCNGEAGNCYLSIDTIATRAGLSSRRTMDQLNALRERGLITRRNAADDPTIPKGQGWVYTVNVDAIAQRPPLTQRHPDAASMTQRQGDEADTTRRSEKKNLEKTDAFDGCNSVTLTQRHPSTVVPYSDTTQEGDQGRSSATARVCAYTREELTYSDPPSAHFEPSRADERCVEPAPAPAPIERAQVAAIKQAIEDALPTLELSGVKGLYAMAQQILAARGGLDEAKLYLEQRGLEWSQRLLEGQRYPAHAIVRLIAKDAPSWHPPSSRALLQSLSAPPHASPRAQLPDWWSSLLNSLYEALKGHRREDTHLSRTYAKQLASLLHHLSRPLHVCCQEGQLTILIDDTGPDPDTFDMATSYIPFLLQKSERIELTATRVERSSAALQRAS